LSGGRTLKKVFLKEPLITDITKYGKMGKIVEKYDSAGYNFRQ
jgi:hypothetical protein